LAALPPVTAGYWIVVDPNSEERQRAAIDDYCRLHDVSIPPQLRFRDVWVTGEAKQRCGFRLLVERIQVGDVRCVVTDSPDHWQLPDWQDWLDFCRGVRLVSVHEGELSLHDLQILKHVFSEREQLLKGHWMPPGHFYSPIPCIRDVRAREEAIFGHIPRELPGINLNETGQWTLLEQFKPYYHDLPFTPEKKEGLRYYYENGSYSYSDGIFLHCVLRHLRPQRIIEIGCGFSSCVILDTNERYLGEKVACTFIEPHAERFLSLVTPGDEKRIHLLQKRLQEVDLRAFEQLEANDVLFVDSTHVSKVGSDVNQIVFEVLPRLQSGVWVHFHDVFYPFEYPKEWIYEGRAWNEDYLLRAFLLFNNSFEIQFFNSYLEHFHAAWFWKEMPLCMKKPGASLWLKKL
jgi:Methyltransferase domain